MVFYMMQYVYDIYISLLYTNHVVECQLYTWLCHCVFVYAHDCILATYLRDVHLYMQAGQQDQQEISTISGIIVDGIVLVNGSSESPSNSI